MIEVLSLKGDKFLVKVNGVDLYLTKSEANYLSKRLEEVIGEKDKAIKEQIFPFSPTTAYKGCWEKQSRRRYMSTRDTNPLSEHFGAHS